MAKDPSQSRIPRIDGLSRIPLPSVLRSPKKSLFGTTKLTKLAPSLLRPPKLGIVTTNTTSIPKSSSNENIGGATFIRDTKCCLFSSKSSAKMAEDPIVSAEECEMLVDETLSLVGSTDRLAAHNYDDNEEDEGHDNGDILIDEASGSRSDEMIAAMAAHCKTVDGENNTTTACDINNLNPNALRNSRIYDLTNNDVLGITNTTIDLDKTPVYLTQTMESPQGGKILSSTPCCDKLLDLTQNIPNLTQELQHNNVVSTDENLLYMTYDVSCNEPYTENVKGNTTRVIHKTSNRWPSEDLLCMTPPNLSSTQEDLTKDGDSLNLEHTLIFSSTLKSDKLLDMPSPSAAVNLPNNVTQIIGSANVAQNDSLDDQTIVASLIGQDESETIKMEIDDQTRVMAMSFEEANEENDDIKNVTQTIEQIQSAKVLNPAKPRFSFGLDLTDCTLDCSIELCDVSVASSGHQKSPLTTLNKQNSFEMDESLGILTPDQMKEFLDSTTTTNNLDLPLAHVNTTSVSGDHKLSMHHCRVDQTPSPEDLPLDPVGVKTDITDVLMSQHGQNVPQSSVTYQELSQTDSDPKTDQMTKSGASKVSNSFITSVTSITSLDTGYQGDGEMSRPASRGADHSPSNGPRLHHHQVKQNVGAILNNQHKNANQANINWNAQVHQMPIARRQDPMTDSDFFTESDADDIFHRGDRRAQVIDGQLYGPMLQAANVYINQPQQGEDSCMESSGIFTDVDNRADDEFMHRCEHDNDMSPDTSTDTIRSNTTECSQKKFSGNSTPMNQFPLARQGENNSSSSSSNPSPDNENIVNTNINNNNSSNGGEQPVLISDVNFGSPKPSNVNDSPKSDKSSTLSSRNKKVSPSRKQNKNEANVKTREMSSVKRGNSTATFNKTRNLSSSNVANDRHKRVAGSVVQNSNDHINVLADDNQENKIPKKTMPPNKWDAVMNKIAVGKTTNKTKQNYNEVKSKVLTGVPRRALSKTPPTGISPLQQGSPKRLTQVSSKRGRTYSKDSQQSSQSDLSVSGGSPKLQQKLNSATRSAKKRDVRTISSSPSDLGPPNKTTNGTARNNRTIISTQKRVPPPVQQPLPLIVPETKGSPPTKKIVPRRPVPQQHVKLPLKDHNRLVGPTTTPTTKGTNSPKSSAIRLTATTSPSPPLTSAISKNGTIVVDTLHQSSPPPQNVGNQFTLNKNIINNNNNNNNNNINNNHTNSNNNILPLASHQPKLPSVVELNLAHSNKGIEALGVVIQYLVYNLDAFSVPVLKQNYERTTRKLLETRLALDETRTSYQELQERLTEKETAFASKEIELNETHRNEKAKIENSLSELERTTRDRILALETELVDKTHLAERRFQSYVAETERKINERESQLLAAKENENDLLKRITALSCTENELRDKVVASENEFGEKLRLAAQRERDLTDKINQLNHQLDELKVKAEDKERELEEKLNLSQDEIVILRHSRTSSVGSEFQQQQQHQSMPMFKHSNSASQTQILQDEVESLRCVLELKQGEISYLRKHNQELQRAADELPAAMIKLSGLESRVEDLQVQLRAKAEEEKDLLQRNKVLQESYAHEVKNRSRLSLHNEELQWKLKQNSEKFAIALTEISKSYQEPNSQMNTSTKSSIASFDNGNNGDHNGSIMNKSNGSDRIVECFEMDDVSPPTSPIIKGVVEKSDSVSWVLEMEDESPEALASRVVRRAGSFRSSFNEKCCSQSPVLKRHRNQGNALSQSASATSILRQNSEMSPQKTQSAGNNISTRLRSKSVSVKPSDVRQIVRSNSGQSNQTMELGFSSWNKEPVYTSSPIVKRTSPNRSDLNGKELVLEEADLTETTLVTSPTTTNSHPFTRTRAASLGCNAQLDHFRRVDKPKVSSSLRKKRGNLITCDPTELTSLRPELCLNLPSHPSVQDLKKAQQHPKESAGEAMVSGSNSEDEATSGSASCDDTASTHSSCSSISGRRHLHRTHHHHHHMRLVGSGGGDADDDVVIGDGDVSWSEDGDQFPSESVV